MRNRDPRVLLLLFSFLPFALWIGGAWLIWQFWNQSGGRLTGIAAVLSGFTIVKWQDRTIAWIYRIHLLGALVDSSPGEWIPVEMERTGTQNKLHVLPDTVGILQKTATGLVLRELHGMELHLAKDETLTTNVSKNNLSCSILFTDRHNNDLIGFVLIPRCTGASLEVAAYGDSRYQWFLKWADLPSASASPAESET